MRIPFLRQRGEKGNDVESGALFDRGISDAMFLEQFRALRAKLEYRMDMLKIKTIAVTSAIAGEGKTISCANLAMNLASGGRKKVLVIDVDLRKSDLAKSFRIARHPGLSEFLSGSISFQDVVHNSHIPGLYIIPGGTALAAPADLLSGEKFRIFLRDVRDRFDVILLDAPPVVPVADAMSLKDQVDGFVFLFRLGFTPHGMLKQAVEEIGEKNIIGVILNGVEPRKASYYVRYYGKYYRDSD